VVLALLKEPLARPGRLAIVGILSLFSASFAKNNGISGSAMVDSTAISSSTVLTTVTSLTVGALAPWLLKRWVTRHQDAREDAKEWDAGRTAALQNLFGAQKEFVQGLMSRLEDLTESVENCEKSRKYDTERILVLERRVMQLEMENLALKLRVEGRAMLEAKRDPDERDPEGDG